MSYNLIDIGLQYASVCNQYRGTCLYLAIIVIILLHLRIYVAGDSFQSGFT
ncbi:uncharacterized protein BDV17DRAFT_116445 [Aspergillus undulatus]|uniref:uncharacterized protein n=1 Tax=Aspergillus undulatus TaxID=1810928 RepID=UPI003CCD02DC